ncbi:hypothetical protein FMN50_13555 [Rhodobacterales bacterium]|nr:hypothetical protein FMN50_13555 [Rhodobacterales bacterium]
MSKVSCLASPDSNDRSRRLFGIGGLIRRLFARTGRVRRLRAGDLPPELLADIGLESEPRQILSFNDKWRRELDLQRK